MPRFITLAVTLLCALASATSAFAGAPLDGSSVLLNKRQSVPRPRGRPNHADLFGYPHGRGDHSGTRGPAPAVNQPMRPGGYVDSRPPNAGADCSRNAQCSTSITNARASCGADGKCGFQCLGRTSFDGSACTGQIVSSRCSFNRQCSTNVPNATGICNAGYCTFSCGDGFYAFGSTCRAADTTCGTTACPPIPGGYNTCSATGTCTPSCNNHLGYRLYCDGDVCQCTNTQNDADNCGAPGNVCPGGYNGRGQRYCFQGTCQLSCYRLTRVTPTNGEAPYCA